jgi:hypothetical protein
VSVTVLVNSRRRVIACGAVPALGNLLVGLISVPARSNISTANLEDWTYLNTLDG